MGLSTIGTSDDADYFLMADSVTPMEPTESPDPSPVSEPTASSAPPPISQPAERRRSIGPWVLIGAVVGGGLLALNIALLLRVSSLQDDLDEGLAAVDASVSRLEGSIGAVSDKVGDFEGQLADINALALAGGGVASAAPGEAPAAVGVSGLPRFDPSVQDPALGVQISGMTGPEYYSGETLAVDAADGKARAWLVWAHWCPYCQQDLPEVKAWVEANAADFPDFEVVSLTTSIDDARGNPLVPYLDELQLPFPVIVDADGSLSSQLGLNAFPFWVFTGPDGTVLGRTAGLLGPERFASIADQLQEIAGA
jgi:thiol-disulfide isomerase/thioredoxin